MHCVFVHIICYDYNDDYCCSQTIVSDLSFSLDTNQDSAHLQIAVMSFINAIVNYKAGEVHVHFTYVHTTPILFLLGKPRV